MLLISWNVAGWGTSVQRIHEHYGTNKHKKRKLAGSNAPKTSGAEGATSCALASYWERHGSPDIVCLQEHKIPKSQLSNRSEPKGCAHLDGYESFWSCCTDEKR